MGLELGFGLGLELGLELDLGLGLDSGLCELVLTFHLHPPHLPLLPLN